MKNGFRQEGIRVHDSPGKGRGVFAAQNFKEGDLIECSPLITLPEKEWPFVSATSLTNYFFETDDGAAAIALGYASLYNHSFEANAEYLTGNGTIVITANREIKNGEEIFIDYGWEGHQYFECGIINKEELARILEEEDDDETT